ncbi:MAG: MBL fold metallo-hydrolase [Paludibacteraceae bacterium]|nr:MBL fold metallo-hydrolase [Paludibacteraceae bacterium]
MRLVVLADNRKLSRDLQTEHGLCIYLETDQYKILLDTGASDIFIQNANKLNVNLQAVNYVFISHGHSDHIGGLPYFLKINKTAKVIMSINIQNQLYFSKRDRLHSISTEFDFNAYSNQIIFVENCISIANEIHIYSNQSIKHATPLGNKNLFRKEKNGELILDNFNHELIFTIGKEKLLVYTGCAHNGLQNILETVTMNTSKPIDWVLGGFHLLAPRKEILYESESEISAIGNALRSKYSKTIFFTGHCTGENAFTTLSQILTDHLIQFYCGYSENL